MRGWHVFETRKYLDSFLSRNKSKHPKCYSKFGDYCCFYFQEGKLLWGRWLKKTQCEAKRLTTLDLGF